jgi:hypothetical protein
MHRCGTCERARCQACGVGPGCVVILWGQDAWQHCGGKMRGDTVGAGRKWDRGRLHGRQDGACVGGRHRRVCAQVGVARSVGQLIDWFDLWVQVMDQLIHHPR